jgi:hypothetical protein
LIARCSCSISHSKLDESNINDSPPIIRIPPGSPVGFDSAHADVLGHPHFYYEGEGGAFDPNREEKISLRRYYLSILRNGDRLIARYDLSMIACINAIVERNDIIRAGRAMGGRKVSGCDARKRGFGTITTTTDAQRVYKNLRHGPFIYAIVSQCFV